jgi:general secretion pathway protein G
MSQNEFSKKKAKGRLFTNLPALLLFGMIAVIAVADLVSSCGQMGPHSETRALTKLRDLQIHILSFRTNAGELPSKLQDLVTRPSHLHNQPWRQYAKRDDLFDPWGHPFVYRVPGHRNPTSYDLFSLGPDCQEGTEDDIWGD